MRRVNAQETLWNSMQIENLVACRLALSSVQVQPPSAINVFGLSLPWSGGFMQRGDVVEWRLQSLRDKSEGGCFGWAASA